METTQDYLMVSLKLLGALGLLIYGMRMMSDALQKMAGPQLRHILARMTTNRLTGMLTGTFVTCAVQSSSATTVMTVSFVSAGLLTLAQAISVIMGANIGTTLTAWIMSLGYNVDLTSVVFPAFAIGIILIYMKRHRFVGDFLFGIAFMFLSLVMLSTAGKEMDLEHNEAVVRFFASFDTNSYWTILAFLGIGTLITCIVQSSAAVMAITILLCSTGVLPIYLGIALVMGENIGTTATANLAALGANTQARRAALAHMFFNVFGVIWILFVFRPFIDMVCGWVGYDVNMASGSPDFLANAAKLSFVLAAFHTSFNVVNTFILIWFIPQIERFVCWVIKPKKVDEEEDFRLHFITSGIMKTPEHGTPADGRTRRGQVLASVQPDREPGGLHRPYGDRDSPLFREGEREPPQRRNQSKSAPDVARGGRTGKHRRCLLQFGPHNEPSARDGPLGDERRRLFRRSQEGLYRQPAHPVADHDDPLRRCPVTDEYHHVWPPL